ncbi:MAG: YceD family protein, partial [Candidatus Methylomirabilales bacterium]
MFVDIARIPAEGLDVQFRGTEDFLDPSGEWVRLLRPVEAALHFCRNPTGILVRGQISSDLQLHCSRCFELFTFPIREGFEVQYRGPLGAEVGEERELGHEELDVDFLDSSRINVEGLVRENVLLTLPVQALCHDECRGLCPQCGINLNRETCPCSS